MLGERREGLKLSPCRRPSCMMVGLQGSGKTTTAAKLARGSRRRGGRCGSSPPTSIVPPPSTSSRRSASSSTCRSTPIATTTDVVQDRARRHRAVDARARSRRDHRHRRPSADRRRDDGRAAAPQGRGPARRDPARRRRHDRPGCGEDRAGLRQRARRHRRDPDQDGRRRARRCGALDLRRARRSRSSTSASARRRDALEEFHPDRMAGRILQRATSSRSWRRRRSAFDADEAKRLEKKVRKEGMDLERLPRRHEADREARAAGGHPEDAPRREHARC